MKTLLNRRFQLLALLSLSSGMPYGFVAAGLLSIFLRSNGTSLAEIGLLSSASLPWTVKFLWSPLLDRYALRWPGRRRSWILLSQLGLLAGMAAFAALVNHALHGPGLTPPILLALGALALLVAFMGATQDIALDAYAVEFLRSEEQAPASGLRTLWWRIGMLLCSGLAVAASDVELWRRMGVETTAAEVWPLIFLAVALVYAPLALLTFLAPEPEHPAPPPRSLRDAIWQPVASYFARPQAVTLALFITFYKFGDAMCTTMVNPFLVDTGMSRAEIGVMQKTVGTVAAIGGALFGGALTPALGLGRALWLFGVVQGSSVAFYALASAVGGARWSVYLAIAGENLSAGMGTAALLALCIRLCEKRYSATQYALLSSLFGLGRWASGPPAGFIAERYGYTTLFLVSLAASVPGLMLLQRIAPLGQRDVPAAEAAMVSTGSPAT